MEEAALGLILIAPTRESLEKSGSDVETPRFLKGKHGASHVEDHLKSGFSTLDHSCTFAIEQNYRKLLHKTKKLARPKLRVSIEKEVSCKNE